MLCLLSHRPDLLLLDGEVEMDHPDLGWERLAAPKSLILQPFNRKCVLHFSRTHEHARCQGYSMAGELLAGKFL